MAIEISNDLAIFLLLSQLRQNPAHVDEDDLRGYHFKAGVYFPDFMNPATLDERDLILRPLYVATPDRCHKIDSPKAIEIALSILRSPAPASVKSYQGF